MLEVAAGVLASRPLGGITAPAAAGARSGILSCFGLRVLITAVPGKR